MSVVLPTHNRVEFLGRAVASVLRQTEQDFELIIVDDASADGTAAYVSGLTTQDSRIRVIRNEQSKGGAGARNEGIWASRGEWTAFLDDDDEWMPIKLRRQLGTLHADASAIACSCSYVQRFQSGTMRKIIVPGNATLRQVLAGSVLGGASMCLCSSEILREIGGFDANFRSAQDWDLWVRLRQKGNIVACSDTLVLYQAHEGPRISNDMQSNYLGARRFYFKHRWLMDASLRRHRLSFNCFIMSHQSARGFRRRIRYLIMSLLNSSPRVSFSYVKSSVPKLIKDAFLTVLTPPLFRARH